MIKFKWLAIIASCAAFWAGVYLIADKAFAQVTNGVVSSSNPTYTAGSPAPLSLSTNGGLRVNCISGCGGGGGGGGTSSVFGDPMPTDGTAIGFRNSSGNMAPMVLQSDGSIPTTDYVTRVTPTDNLSISNLMGRFRDSAGNYSLLGVYPYVYDPVYNNADMLRATPNGVYVQGSVADGAVNGESPIYIGGTDGTNKRALRTDTTGNLYAVLKDGSGNVVPYNPNGSTTSPNASPVTVATDQIGIDGTVLPDASGSALNAVLFSFQTDGYAYASVQATSIGSGNFIRWQTSNDNANWQTVGSLSAFDGSSSYTSTQGLSAGGVYVAPTAGKYMRLIISTYGSGTVTVKPVLHSVDPSIPFSQIVAQRLLARSSNPGATSNGAQIQPYSDLIGRQIVLPYAIPESTWVYAPPVGGILNTTTGVTIVAAQAAGIRNYVKGCQLSAESLTNATTLVLNDGASGTTMWRSRVGTSGLPMVDVKFDPPLRGSAATLVEAKTETASGGGAVFLACQGFAAP